MKSKSFYIKSLICMILMAAAMLSPLEVFAVTPTEDTPVPSAILIDAESGMTLYEKDADKQIAPASTTKVLTALLVFEAVESGQITLDDQITATEEIIAKTPYDASKVVPNIQAGETMTVRQYLYCLLMVSDCTACDILGEYVSGSVDEFVALMNRRAAELGCTGTNFVNTHGYPDANHYSTARSLAIITAEAMKHEGFCEIFGTIKLQLDATNISTSRMLYTSNWLIWNPEKITSIYCVHYYPYATGGKTGTSNASGHCLVSSAEKDGARLVCVITGGKIVLDSTGQKYIYQHYSESARLFEWGFANYLSSPIIAEGEVVTDMKVSGGEKKKIELYAQERLDLLLPVDADRTKIEYDYVIYDGENAAPVSTGDVVGDVVATYDGVVSDSVPLCASQDVAVRVETSSCNAGGFITTVLAVLLVITLVLCAALLFLLNSPKYSKRTKYVINGLVEDLSKRKKSGYSAKYRR